MMHILIVNSEYETRHHLYQILSPEGYDITLWDGDLQATDFTQFSEPLLVIGDWDSKVADSYFWPGVKGNAKVPPICCLMLLPADRLSDSLLALNTGVDDWITLPIDSVELKARVLASQQTLKLKQDLQEQKKQLKTELAEAESYVRSLLPDDLTEKIPINARFVPSSSLGGDCYDFYWLDPDYLVIYLLDVSGHGLGSALLSTSVLNMLRSQSLPDVNFYRPEKVLNALNDTFQMNDQNEKYFTMWYGVYNRANRQLLYANAGHPPAVLVSKQAGHSHTVESLRSPGLPVGMLTDIQYRWQRCHIPPDSRLYLFSDGVYEIKQQDNTIMGLDDFLEILAKHNLDQTIDHILEQVSARTQDQTFMDDLSLIEVCLD